MGKVVVTSAYPELTHMVQEIAGELDVNVIVIEAVLEDAVEQVEKVMGKHMVDVLVSRGGTAELLKQRFHVPVISAAPSEFDILLALTKAKDQNTQIGYFSYPAVTDQGFLAQVQSILGIDISHYTYTNATEMATQMEAAYRQGCEVIVGGGHRGVHLAKAYGIEGRLVYSSRNTLVGALEQAKEIARLRNKERMEEERHRRIVLAKGLVAHYSFADLIGNTLQETILKAKRFSQVDATVSIWGESGTGKELFAHSIHASSPRCHGPFVAVNCAALPETLLESELFGYEEGAFTGAKKGGKIGLFELANEGTIFLDEIGKMSMGLQAGLLRVLQTREVRRVGGDSNIPVNVRVIAASNEDLRGAVEAGEFRADLYYRLNILTLRVPSLRERPGDVAALKGSILQRLAGKLGFTPKVAPEFTEALFRYNWPGNVRELENVLERYAVLFGADNMPDVEELRDSFPELPWGTYQGWDNRNQKDFTVQDDPGNTGFDDGTTHVLNKETTALGCETSGGIDVGSSRGISNGIMNGIKDGSPAGGLYRENKAGIAAKIVAKEASDEGDPDVILGVLPGTLEEMEIQLIMAMLKTVNGNRSLLAEKLGISRTTLWKKLQPFYPSDISH